MSEQTNLLEETLKLTKALIAQPSVTPDDANCQVILGEILKSHGFSIQQIDRRDTKNLWATRSFTESGPHLLFAGHTDVVPSGPTEQWQTPPFEPTIIDQVLYGRGAADMKSSLAAMMVAVTHLNPEALQGTLSFLITSDEEGDATDGTQYAIDQLVHAGIQPDYCIVGEPSSSVQLGDVVRCGRRGSINGHLTIRGIQGHVAYPQDAKNAIHAALPVLQALTNYHWDEGNQYYPATSLQISNLNAGTGANNVIPGELHADFNLRYSTEQTAAGIQRQVTQLLNGFDIDWQVDWKFSGHPFLTEQGHFSDAVVNAIDQHMQHKPELSTSGGTSDGRFIAPWRAIPNDPLIAPTTLPVQVIEFGPTNATIHKIDERIHLNELQQLPHIYLSIINNLLA